MRPAVTEPVDDLALAAECMERGDQPAAADHLNAYVRQHPDQLMFRAHLAELLFRLDRLAESQAQFERFIAAAQDASGPPKTHLVHCHTRLMEIGQRTGNRSAELLHRGVGLLLLVKQLDANKDTRDDQTNEEVLCKAVRALVEARELRPTDPRVHLYLADAYEQAGNAHAADVARATARNLTCPGSLTPAEGRRLTLASDGR